ncbi:hypothetical protein SAMN04490244_12038 [Tranquillimonas rosea]|uniref:Uncharacterized protein n=1 Tax=Tranquillimonas rosea TaxID=641238 RepID=A0A1H9X972_9RHOB|nr:hypothetical protein [Tranquillimonas rosea]SES42427.1 hypothetical protein SAMN04490244_12038 [Tranquillimonas rosea]
MIRVLMIGAAGYALWRHFNRPHPRPALARPDNAGPPKEIAQVRDAGPGQMRDAPGRWDRVDEEMDETFPASDPPARY